MDAIDKMLEQEFAKALSAASPFDGQTFTSDTAWATNTCATPTAVTFDEIVALVNSLPKMPFVNPDKCKVCGAILNEQFIEPAPPPVPAVPLYFDYSPGTAFPLLGPPVAYLCPPCMERVKKQLTP